MSANTTSYAVVGMSCDHCVRAVTAEVSKVAGVAGVEIELASGTLTVASDGAVDDDAVKAAVAAAGYEVAA